MRAGQGEFEKCDSATSLWAGWLLRLACLLGCSLVALLVSGCARFPAIDPNGQSIFLPHPASTQIRVPQIHPSDGNPSILPQDAYPTPLDPPPCVDGSCTEPGGIHNLFHHKKKALTSHFAHKDPSKCGEIQLSPLVVVAPVDGEVLLLAGICGKDGYLMKREPLEWMLAPGSVGQFIEVGDDAKGRLVSSLRPGPKVEKLDVDFARGRTSARETLLTKGTPGCDDDVQIQEGQTWLSISSPNEGVSHVTVLAPDSELWDRRRQTATIYWVDSQANFPAPQAVRAPSQVQLVTRVTSSRNLVPATGWFVRYTIVDPSVAAFVPSPNTNISPPINTNIFVATVDANGQAVATLAPTAAGRGTTPVHIEVIKPQDVSNNLPELVLHQADTFVSFSSPGLQVTSSGPPVAAVGDIVEYTAVMANPGDVDVENSRLIAILPAGTELVEQSPLSTRQVNGSLLWEQNLLPAGQQLEVRVRLKLNAPQDMAVQFRAEADGLQAAAPPVVTRIVAPSVRVRFEPANRIAQAELGELVLCEIDVQNTGPQTLVDLLMEIDTTPGLQPELSGTRALQVPVTQVIPMLQPGQADSRGVAFRVTQEGQHTATLRIRSTAGGAAIAEQTINILGVPRRPKTPAMEATIRMQSQASVGETVQTAVIVINRGETLLSDIRVAITHDLALQPVATDNANAGRVQPELNQPRLIWGPPPLEPGQYAQLLIDSVVKAPATQASVAVTATSGGVTASAQGQIQLVSRDGQVSPPAASTPPATQESPRAGDWNVSIIDLNDPTMVNVERPYNVIITNQQNLPDSQVRIELLIPQGVSLRTVSSSGTPVLPTYSESTQSWVLPTVQFVRAGDQLRYTFTILPSVPQNLLLRVRVSSAARPNFKEAVEPVTVTAQ